MCEPCCRKNESTGDRRKALLDWAATADGVVVEDDYDSEFRFGGRALNPLQSLDVSGRVIYLGSFSEVMLPTLRLGFAILPEPLHSAFRKAKYLADWHTAVPLQAAAAEFIDDGLLGKHIRRMQRVYSRRHERTLEVLRRDFRQWLEPIPAHGGLHVTARLLNAEVDDDARLAIRAADRGVGIFPLSHHLLDQPPEPGLLFGYGAISTDRTDEGLALLTPCL